MAYTTVFITIVAIMVFKVHACPQQNGQTVVSQNVVNNANTGLYGGSILNSNLGGIGCGYPNQIISGNPVGILNSQTVIGSVAQPIGYNNAYPYGIGGLPLAYANNYAPNGQIAVQNVAVSTNNCPSCGCQGSIAYPYGNYGSCNNCGNVVVV